MTQASLITSIGAAPKYSAKFGVRLVSENGEEITVWTGNAKEQMRLYRRLSNALMDLEAARTIAAVQAA